MIHSPARGALKCRPLLCLIFFFLKSQNPTWLNQSKFVKFCHSLFHIYIYKLFVLYIYIYIYIYKIHTKCTRPTLCSCSALIPVPFVSWAPPILWISVFDYGNFFAFSYLGLAKSVSFLKDWIKHIFQEVFGGHLAVYESNWARLWSLEVPSLYYSQLGLRTEKSAWDLEGGNEVAAIFRLWSQSGARFWDNSEPTTSDLQAHLRVRVAPGPAVLPAPISPPPSASLSPEHVHLCGEICWILLHIACITEVGNGSNLSSWWPVCSHEFHFSSMVPTGHHSCYLISIFLSLIVR